MAAPGEPGTFARQHGFRFAALWYSGAMVRKGQGQRARHGCFSCFLRPPHLWGRGGSYKNDAYKIKHEAQENDRAQCF